MILNFIMGFVFGITFALIILLIVAWRTVQEKKGNNSGGIEGSEGSEPKKKN